jgi:hypothetical protein
MSDTPALQVQVLCSYDYAAWSREFNMHFGYYRAGAGLHKNGSILMMPLIRIEL